MDYTIKYPTLADALYAALIDDPFYFTMENSVADRNQGPDKMRGYLDYSMGEAEQYGELIIPTTHQYGASIWSKPIPNKSAQMKSQLKREFLQSHMGPKSLAVYDDIVMFMSKASESFVSADAWYLSIVGILPAYQGQGLGQKLVSTILNRTDELGVASYLETFTPKNKPFYQRLGFADAACLFEPTVEADYWLMVRPPQ